MKASHAAVSVVALNLDGVCIHDGCRPALRVIAERWGASYDREIEIDVLSEDRTVLFGNLARKLGIPGAETELRTLFFEEREKYPSGPFDGLEETLGRLRRSGVRILCYGASGEDYFQRKLGDLAGAFDEYVCVDGYRPGVHRIVRDVCRASFEEVLFVDDMSNVARAARAAGSPFIGVLSEFPWAIEAQGLSQAGCELVVASVSEIDLGAPGMPCARSMST